MIVDPNTLLPVNEEELALANGDKFAAAKQAMALPSGPLHYAPGAVPFAENFAKHGRRVYVYETLFGEVPGGDLIPVDLWRQRVASGELTDANCWGSVLIRASESTHAINFTCIAQIVPSQIARLDRDPDYAGCTHIMCMDRGGRKPTFTGWEDSINA